MIKVVAPKDRDVRLSSTAGPVIHLRAGQEKVLPPLFAPIAAVNGCSVLPVDGEKLEVPEVPAGPSDEDRMAKLIEVAEVLLDENNRENFTTQGRLRKQAATGLVDFEFTSEELNAAADHVRTG